MKYEFYVERYIFPKNDNNNNYTSTVQRLTAKQIYSSYCHCSFECFFFFHLRLANVMSAHYNKLNKRSQFFDAIHIHGMHSKQQMSSLCLVLHSHEYTIYQKSTSWERKSNTRFKSLTLNMNVCICCDRCDHHALASIGFGGSTRTITRKLQQDNQRDNPTVKRRRRRWAPSQMKV